MSIGTPQQDDRAWRCTYEIEWPAKKESGEALGSDGLQAPYLAIEKASLHLYVSHYHAEKRMVRDEPGRGYGLPLPHSARDLAIGDDKRL